MKEIVTFAQGKLNSDIDISLLPKGDYPVDPTEQYSGAYNVIMQQGNLGVNVNVSGDSFINFNLPSSSVILATCYDNENDCLYILAYNYDLNQLIRFNKNNTKKILISDYYNKFNFQSDEVIRSIKLIGSGDDKQLIWVSNVNSPKCVNISRVEYLMDNYIITDFDYELALTPPITPVTYLIVTTDNETNNLLGKTYQFTDKYIYRDGKESSWSEFTDVIVLDNVEYMDGFFVSEIINNTIRISRSSIPDDVVKVKISYRYADTEVNEPSSFYEYDVVDVVSNAYSYDFYDNKTKYTADQSDIFLKEYSVPEYATDIEILKDNKICLSNPVVGKDNTIINISLGTVSAYIGGNIYFEAHATVYNYGDTIINLNTIIANTLSQATSFTLVISILDDSHEVLESLNVNYVTNQDYSYVIATFLEKSTQITATRTGINIITITSGYAEDSYIYITTLKKQTKSPTVKLGQKRHLGIEYSDGKGRISRVNTSSESIIDIPNAYNFYSKLYDFYVFGIKYEIIHLPPSWAKTWRFVDGGSNIANYYQIPLLCKTQDTNPIDIIYNTTINQIQLKIDQADNRVLANNIKYNSLITFDAVVGDKIRFVSKIKRDSYITSESKIIGHWILFSNFIELEIIDIDSGVYTIESSIGHSDLLDIIGDGDYDMIMVEVLSFKKDYDQDNILYFGIGDVMDCSNGYHNISEPISMNGAWEDNDTELLFESRNQTNTQSAKGILNLFDSYKYYCNAYQLKNTADYTKLSNVLFLPETRKASLCYNSEKAYGKLNYADAQAKQKTLIGLAYGGSYSEDGLIFNEINKFTEDDRIDLDDKQGIIYGIDLVGYTLKAIQRSKITSIGNTVEELYNSDGSSSLTSINATLGNPNPSIDNYGTVFPLSIVKNAKYLYFYDIYHHCVVRNAINGNEKISDYWMSNFWKQRSKALLTSGIENLEVCAVFDEINDMYIITIVDTVTASNSFTLGFHEPSNSWKSFYGYLPSLYATMSDNRLFAIHNTTLYGTSLKSSDLFEKYINERRNYFFDEDYESFITIVINENNEFKKFLAIAEDSNDVWEAYDDDSIITGEDSVDFEDTESYIKHTKKQQSRLRENEDVWKFQNNMFKAAFRRNMLTNQSTADVFDLINGDELRGKYLKIKLSNSNTVETNIKRVEVEYKPYK